MLSMYSWSVSHVVAGALLLICTGRAEAGWLTIKNDTTQPIVVQETVIVNGQPKRGKPTKLLPGETLREFVSNPAVKKFEVLSAGKPGQVLWSGNISCKDETQSYFVSTADGKLTVTPASGSPPTRKR